MRVIAGMAKGHRLKVPRGWPGRPTADRVKEALFNILAVRLPGSRFLDLFAGTGNIGIEALSRGAKQAVFVEQDARAIRVIRDNLTATSLDRQGKILKMDVAAAIRRVVAEEQFDLIFIDPPYGRALEITVLNLIGRFHILKPGGWVVVESSKRETPPEECAGLALFRQEKYGDTMLSFYTCGA